MRLKLRPLDLLILLTACTLVNSDKVNSEDTLSWTFKHVQIYHQQQLNYVKENPKFEPILPILIERHWVPKRERSKRAADGSNGNPDKTPPKTLIVSTTDLKTRIIHYSFAVLLFLISLPLLVFSAGAIKSTATVVIVKNLHDSQSPPREYPATLSLDMSAEKKEKPLTQVIPPTDDRIAEKFRKWRRHLFIAAKRAERADLAEKQKAKKMSKK